MTESEGHDNDNDNGNARNWVKYICSTPTGLPASVGVISGALLLPHPHPHPGKGQLEGWRPSERCDLSVRTEPELLAGRHLMLEWWHEGRVHLHPERLAPIKTPPSSRRDAAIRYRQR